MPWQEPTEEQCKRWHLTYSEDAGRFRVGGSSVADLLFVFVDYECERLARLVWMVNICSLGYAGAARATPWARSSSFAD